MSDRIYEMAEEPTADWAELAAAMTADALPRGAWWGDGAICAQIDPELFFPPKGTSARNAKRICQRCPVIEACREWAVETDQQFGVWGGLTPTQIHRERMKVMGYGFRGGRMAS